VNNYDTYRCAVTRTYKATCYDMDCESVLLNVVLHKVLVNSWSSNQLVVSSIA
jgi:hypothetical protein